MRLVYRHWAFAAGALVAALVAVGVYGFLRNDRNVIAPGVQVGPVAIGGLSAPAARARLDAWAHALSAPVVIRAGGRRVRLSLRLAVPSVDTVALVDEALQASRRGSIFTRAMRGLVGGSVNVSLDPQIGFGHGLNALVRRAEARLDRPARDASVVPSPTGLTIMRSRSGFVVDPQTLRNAIMAAVVATGSARSVTVPRHRLAPHISSAQLGRRYPSYITVDRGRFTLRVYQHLRLTNTYPIAVGQVGLQTPAGVYHIQDKVVDPSWNVPNSAWAGSLAGQVIPPGPADPLKARWMGIFNGAGIHGTDNTGSIGSAVSHGCIRMTIPGVIDLYDRVSVGTPIFIGD